MHILTLAFFKNIVQISVTVFARTRQNRKTRQSTQMDMDSEENFGLCLRTQLCLDELVLLKPSGIQPRRNERSSRRF